MDFTNTFYARVGKRAFDLVGVSAALLVLWPVLAAIGLAIRVTSRGPVLFVQERLGRKAAIFRAYKFRTMVNRPRVPDTVAFSGNASDVTPLGRLLRRTKLDELPQLFNVLTGDMSIIGPRPQLPIQLAEFDDNAKLRLLVRPGLTGMAQTHGNVALTWPERWYYDAEYVRNLSLKLDLRLMFRTISVILCGEEAFLRHPPIAGERRG